MKRSIICLVLLFIVSSSALGQKVTKTNERTKRLFAGSWIADLEKSQRDANHQFSGLTIKFEFVDDTVLLTYSGINKSGNAEGATRKLHPDGKERPIPEAPAYTQIDKWRASNVLESVSMKDGRIAGQSTYEISSDKGTMTAKVRGIDASGRPFEQIIVLNREVVRPK
jgi:hypothetical protein